jgi:hypothetical protein
MTISGSIADQSNGKVIPNATIWEIPPDGQSAWVVGVTDYKGAYSIDVDPSSTVNFVADGYTGVVIPGSQAALADQVLLAPDGSLTAKISLSGFPAWLWVVLGGAFIFLIGDGKKKRR